MTRFIIALFIAASAYAEDAPKKHSGVTLEDSSSSKIDNIRVDIADPGALVGDGFNPPVKSLGRPTDVDSSALNPKGLNLVGETKEAPSKTSDFSFGVSAGGANGLMKTQVSDTSNVVESLTLPDGTVKKNPMKESGGLLLKTDLANLATGKVSNINLRDGTPLGKPTSPQAG